jgi:DNA-binding NarL/FixJ family response regulator
MKGQCRILIADDHEMVRRGLRSLLDAHEDMVVCGEASNGLEAVTMAEKLRPNLVIMDITMPELNGIEAVRRIRKTLPDCEILVLTMHHSEQLVQELLDLGVRGYVLKTDAGELVETAVRHLCEHHPFFTSRVSEVLLGAYRGLRESPPVRGEESTTLTSREREVVQLIAEGKTTKELAARLGISEKTAETHRTHIMHKLGVHSVSEVVRYAIRNKMIEP